MNIEFIHSLFLKSSGVVIDTRKVVANSFFVALKGANFDANTFAAQALEAGASFALIDNKAYYIDERTLLVDDCLIALQELAKYHRKYLGLTILALTGSNGKTTTKELIQAVLSQSYKTKATFGNLNNHIGVPLTLLSFTKDIEIGIVEMGANHQKEISFLCELAQPNLGYITNFGKAHLEGFGGVEGVIKGKSEMYDFFNSGTGKVFVNADDPIQLEKTVAIPRVTFGHNTKSVDYPFSKIESNPFVVVNYQDFAFKSNLIGAYNSTNIMAAITIGLYFNVSIQNIIRGIENYTPDNNRSQIIARGNHEVLLDAYNANPSSMEAAISNFLKLDKHSKILILGDMFELGNESGFEHQKIVNRLQDESGILCFFVGSHFYASKKELSHFKFYTTYEAFEDDFVPAKIPTFYLIKGSRGMSLERIVPKIV
ncbi:UDP-N-acetylmuramoyl-tripeptide--D-alanyl-D-alanine ligase [Flavobacterium sp.]|uniref:UDP-N-acetylmuramoyl-tripeptide--D-alanyl-D- alanine ligase n=1 Tax=Flavobacterium sp. TaxID=239 RepID=UPI002FD98957